MPNRIPITEVRSAVAELIKNVRLGLKDAAEAGCVQISPGKFQVTLEAVFPAGTRVEEQTTTQQALPGGAEVTTTQEPGSTVTSATVKSGSYTQSGQQGSQQGGGSRVQTDNTWESAEGDTVS